MADHFARLGLPRRPWLDPDQIKAAFVARSGTEHPDKAAEGNARLEANSTFADLNAAYNILRNSRDRLLHLLVLHGFEKAAAIQSVPPSIMDFFTPVAHITAAVDRFLTRKKEAQSPMVQAQLFAEGVELTDDLQKLQSRVADQIARIEADLKTLTETWDDQHPIPDPTARMLQECAAALGFLQRWQSQLQERIVRIAF